MKSAISANELSKKYKSFTLGGLNFEIPKGFSTALIGANGAGKTTLLDVICGITSKSGGEITYFNGDTEPTPEVKERIGYCAAQSLFPLDW